MSARDASRIHDGEAFGVLLRRNFVTGATVMMRRIVVEYALPVPDAWLHDEWLAIAAAAAGVVDFLPEPLIDYRQHSANQIGARTLTFSGATGRLTSSRAARNERLLRRAESLPRRLETLTPAVSPLAVAKASAKLDHERFRSALPASRLRRVLPVFREMVGHRYSLFGGGLPDVVRDVVQPD
jgi:hypothetical protein